MTKQELKSKFEHLFTVCSSQSFLAMESLGGEVPFFISAYDPEDEVAVSQEINSLIEKLDRAGVEVKNINLFDLCVRLLKDRGIWERALQAEPRQDKSRFLRMMQQPLNPENHIAPAIRELLDSANPALVFLTGIGMVFPFIRSHTILNNLQSIIREMPTVMFFPGQYDGTKLELFGRMKDDNYYRAFNIDKFNR